MIFENDRVRVLEYQSKAGEKNPMHSHPAHVLYSTTAGKVRHTLPDGKTVDRELKGAMPASTWSPHRAGLGGQGAAIGVITPAEHAPKSSLDPASLIPGEC